MSSRALDALDRVLRAQSDADDVLRSTVEVLTKEPGVTWAGIAFLENDETTLGPSAGVPRESERTKVGGDRRVIGRDTDESVAA